MKIKYIIFDLDDTLMNEIDYLKSAYKEIAEIIDFQNSSKLYEEMYHKYQMKENVFDYVTDTYNNYSKEELLTLYRNHFPKINLSLDVKEVLQFCKTKGYKVGLITDGRLVTQRNKLKALAIEDIFNKIIISEEFGSTKPNENNYKIFIEEDIQDYFYVGDNVTKDFISPNKLGWTSICLLDSGNNIHSQNFDIKTEYLPKFKVKLIKEILDIISH